MSTDLESAVRKYFKVKDIYMREQGGLEFRVFYEDNSKANFVSLCRELNGIGYTAELSGNKEDASLTIFQKNQKREAIPVLVYVMAFLTVGSIIFSGILQQILYSCLINGFNPFYLSAFYITGIVSIILFHEFFHYLMALKKGMSRPVSLLLPGLSGVTSFLPSLGSVLMHREKCVNKDHLFDLSVSGPLAGLVLSTAFFIVGQYYYFPVQTNPSIACENISITPVSPNLLQIFLSFLWSPKVPNGYTAISVFSDISVVGYLITFFSLLPCSIFDGGVLSRLTLGKWSSALSVASIIGLLAVDSPTYWLIAVALSFVVNRGLEKGTKDEISDLSNNRKILFIVLMAIMLLCIPLPQNIFYLRV